MWVGGGFQWQTSSLERVSCWFSFRYPDHLQNLQKYTNILAIKLFIFSSAAFSEEWKHHARLSSRHFHPNTLWFLSLHSVFSSWQAAAGVIRRRGCEVRKTVWFNDPLVSPSTFTFESFLFYLGLTTLSFFTPFLGYLKWNGGGNNGSALWFLIKTERKRRGCF